MANKRQILEGLNRNQVRGLVDTYSLEARERRSKDALIDALIAARRVKAEDILGALSPSEAEALCSTLGLSPGPKQKAKLIAHITGAKATAGGAAKKTSARKTGKKASKKKAARKASKKKASRRKKSTRSA